MNCSRSGFFVSYFNILVVHKQEVDVKNAFIFVVVDNIDAGKIKQMFWKKN